MTMDGSTLFSNLIFGGVGIAAFLYGKKTSSWQPMVIGIALLAYSYFVPGALWQWLVGALLTVALFIFK